MQDFSQLLQRLTDGGLEFVIVGGYAALTHGSTIVTRDLDICAMLTSENVENFLFGDGHAEMTPQQLSFLDHPAPGTPLQNLYLQTDAGVIDILSSILGVGDFGRLKSHAEELEVGGRKYAIISLDDLIVAKEAIGREKDLLAAKELRAIAAKRRS